MRINFFYKELIHLLRKFIISSSKMLMLGSLLLVLNATAQQENNQKKTHQTQAISADVFDVLSKAQQAQEKGDFDETIQYLDELKARNGKKELKPYEKAQLWSFYAYAYLSKENYPKAISAFKKVLEQPDLPEAQITNTYYTLAQLYLADDHVQQAITLLEQWFTMVTNPVPDAYVLLAQAYIQDKQFDAALKPLLSAFAIAKKQDKEEKENWYVLLQYIYAEKQQYKKQEEVLRLLVSRWPKKQYWLGLFGVYSVLENEKQQLNVLETIYVQGLLDQKSYLISLAQLLVANGTPFKAAKVMEQALADNLIESDAKNLERLGEYWRLAQEVNKALPYFIQAAKLAEDGAPGMRLAYLYMSIYQYQNAAQQIQLALSKGGVKRPLDAQILLGTALFHAGQYEQAALVFQALVKVTKERELEKQQKQAQQWLQLIKAEIKRIEEVKAYLAF